MRDMLNSAVGSDSSDSSSSSSESTSGSSDSSSDSSDDSGDSSDDDSSDSSDDDSSGSNDGSSDSYPKGGVTDIHHQDPIHVAKRLKNNIDSLTRLIAFGNNAVVTMAALDALRTYGNRTDNMIDHGLVVGNTQQKDRQNWESAQHIMVRKVRHALWQHQDVVSGLQGLILYLEMAWKYTHMYFSRVLTFRERIEHACYIIHFLRLWRAWVFLQPGLTITGNFLTRETFRDTELSCHSAILTIVYYSMHLPNSPLHMDRIGTDALEIHFSAQGSWVVNRRDYNFLTMCRFVHKHNWNAEVLAEGKLFHNDKL